VFDVNRLPDACEFYASEGVVLAGRGTWRRALCVFHDDHSPSMHVNVESGAWNCKACCTKGSMVDFVMHTRGLEFREACEALGAWTTSSDARRELSDREMAIGALAVFGSALHRTRGIDTPTHEALVMAARRAHVESRWSSKVERDVLTVFVVAGDVARGNQVTDRDWSALAAAAGRLMEMIKRRVM